MNLLVTLTAGPPFTARLRDGATDIRAVVPPEVYAGLDAARAKQAAMQWAFARKAEREAEQPVGVMSLDGVMAIYRRRNPDNVSGMTLIKNEQLYNALMRYEPLRALPVSQIDLGIVQDFVQAQRMNSVGERTISNRVRFLRQLLSHSLDWQRETGCTGLRLSRLPKFTISTTKARSIPLGQFAALLGARIHRDTERLHRILVVGVTTMLRRDVLFGLRWEWLDLARRWMVIPAEFMKGRTGQKRPLSVPLCDWAVEAVGEPGPSPYVFSAPGSTGKAWGFDASMRSLAVAADVPAFTPHDLRRTGASWLAEAGVDESRVSILLGHATSENRHGQRLAHVRSVTAAKYLFVEDGSLRRDVAVFDRIRGEIQGNVVEFKRDTA